MNIVAIVHIKKTLPALKASGLWKISLLVVLVIVFSQLLVQYAKQVMYIVTLHIIFALTAGHIGEVTTLENRDKDMIKAMDFIKSYCKDINECLNCPMYDNCHSSDDNKRFPYFWYIPEV